jgi:endoribonuclease Dicer
VSRPPASSAPFASGERSGLTTDGCPRSTSLRVGKLFGALGVNLCSPSEWTYNFENFDCLVVTAQLILDSLAHGFLRMEQIALLVFDEAHHAKSNQ